MRFDSFGRRRRDSKPPRRKRYRKIGHHVIRYSGDTYALNEYEDMRHIDGNPYLRVRPDVAAQLTLAEVQPTSTKKARGGNLFLAQRA